MMGSMRLGLIAVPTMVLGCGPSSTSDGSSSATGMSNGTSQGTTSSGHHTASPTSTATGTSDATTTGSSANTDDGESTAETGSSETKTTSASGDSSSGTATSIVCPLRMAFIEGGSFVNGDDPMAERVIDSFCIDVTEVTVSNFEACVDAGGCTAIPAGWHYSDYEALNWNAPGRTDHPVNGVEPDDAEDYCAWISKRLPTEWEWEWAARGRDAGRTYPWGEDAPTCTLAAMNDPNAGGEGCGASSTSPVGSKPAGASRDGLFDMAGNLSELTSNTIGPARVVRGGAWGGSASGLRTSARDDTGGRNVLVGFRCATNE